VSLYLQLGRQDRGHLPTVLGAAVVPAPLRLRHASRQVGADGRRQPEAEVYGGGRGRAASQGHHGRQPAQIPRSGPFRVHCFPLCLQGYHLLEIFVD